jgi:flagellar biosynthesis/type III secretory pathway M-ring protein FliF/YscJ
METTQPITLAPTKMTTTTENFSQLALTLISVISLICILAVILNIFFITKKILKRRRNKSTDETGRVEMMKIQVPASVANPSSSRQNNPVDVADVNYDVIDDNPRRNEPTYLQPINYPRIVADSDGYVDLNPITSSRPHRM